MAWRYLDRLTLTKAGPVATSVPTVASYLDYWLQEIVKRDACAVRPVRPAARGHHRAHLGRHIDCDQQHRKYGRARR